MASSHTTDTGLGTAGLIGGSMNGSNATIATDLKRGWQTAGKVTSADTAITDLNDIPARAKRLPFDGQNVAVRILATSSNTTDTVTGKVYLFPYDPGTGTKPEENTTDGAAAGELIATETFTMSALTADSPSVAADTDKKVSDTFVYDRRGYEYIVVYMTAVSGLTIGNGVEAVYRCF